MSSRRLLRGDRVQPVRPDGVHRPRFNLPRKDDECALADLAGRIRPGPKSAEGYTRRSPRCASKRDCSRAAGDLDGAVRLNPDSPSTPNGRAWLWATRPDENVIDGKAAVASTTRAREPTGWKEADQPDAPAAA
jgi:hypothetical protein